LFDFDKKLKEYARENGIDIEDLQSENIKNDINEDESTNSNDVKKSCPHTNQKNNTFINSVEYGIGFCKKGSYQEAITFFSRILEEDENNSDAYYYRGTAYSMINEIELRDKDILKSSSLGNVKALDYLKIKNITK
jgi:tetratricopeptide (TPR) repeat protein